MRDGVTTTSIFQVPGQVLAPSFEWLSNSFRLPPSFIGATISVGMHSLLGAALLYRADLATPIAPQPDVALVEFVPVGLDSAHPRMIAQHDNLPLKPEPLESRHGERGGDRIERTSDTKTLHTEDRSTEPVSNHASTTDSIARAGGAGLDIRADGGAHIGALQARYEAAVFSKLEGAKRYPARALHRRLEGNLILGLHLRPDGGVHSVVITRSSGLPVFDQEALQMVSRAMPFPPAPTGIDRSALEFEVPIAFRLE